MTFILSVMSILLVCSSSTWTLTSSKGISTSANVSLSSHLTRIVEVSLTDFESYS